MEKVDKNKNIPDKIILFNENLEYINKNQIEEYINKISKNLYLDGLIEEDEIKYEKEIECSKSILYSKENKILKFPNYDGSFKNDINIFLMNNQNKDLNQLYELILKEIQKLYLSYTHIENILYKKINYYIQFSDAKDNTPMEIISKIKEISETLSDTIKFIETYLYPNFNTLKNIFNQIDQKLSNLYEVESISLYFLLDIFDLPNNELSYMLMFKIIDEESSILKYIVEILDNQVNNKTEDNSSNNIENSEKSTECDLLEKSTKISSPEYEAMLNIKNKYIKAINEYIINIDSYSFFRAKYYNKYIYIKGNYGVDNNLFLNNLSEENDDNNEEFLPINSLIDEELIINKFIQKSLIKKFLKYFKSRLRSSFKKNENLILLHTIQYNIISIYAIYSYKDFNNVFMNNTFFYLGKAASKILFNTLIKKRKKLKNLLIISNIILISSLFIHMLFLSGTYYKYIFIFSRFLLGLSYSKNIETKFITNYIPKLLIKQTIKQYYSIILLSLSIGFFLISFFNSLFSFVEKDKTENKKLDINNIIEIIFGIISIFISILNFYFFNEPNYYDTIRTNSFRSSTKNIISVNNKEDKKDTTSILSYGKAKLISFKEKNKAKLLEESLKMDVGQKNYEGTNQIFNILQKLIITENTSGESYTNKAVKGYILLFGILYMIFIMILFFNPIINASNKKDNINIFESKNKIWLFGFSYLFSFLIYKFNLIKISKDIFMFNITILIFICFEISLSFILFLCDITIFNKTPIEFDNYFFYIILSLILFFNIITEIFSLKVMIREIPIEKKIGSINIDNFLHIYECLIKAATFILLYIFTYNQVIKKTIIVKGIINVLYILGCIFFYMVNFKRREIALVKIINKVTYETF